MKKLINTLTGVLLLMVFAVGPQVAAQDVRRSISSASRVLFGDGSATSPSMTFGTETNTGWYRAGALNLAASVGGVSQVSVGSGIVTINPTAGGFGGGGVKFFINTNPTISSGFGGSPAVTAGVGTSSFRVNVGTGGVATSGVVGMPAATTGWNCQVTDTTNNTVTRQTASNTTTVTVTAAAAWAASDVLIFNCMGY